MAATKFLTVIVQTILQNVQMVGEELDEATVKRMQQRAEQLRRISLLLHELEQRALEQRALEQRALEQRALEQRVQEQRGFAWRALLFAPLQHWQFWAVAGVLLLLFGLCWWLRRRSYEPDRRREEESSRSNSEEESTSSSSEEESTSSSSEEESTSSNSEEESTSSNSHEQSSGSERENMQGEEEKGDDVGRFLEKHIQWPAQDLAEKCQMVKQMMHTYLLLFRQLLENSFFPGLQPAIAVGSAFEGWSPSEEDVTYCMLMPLVPPKGHTFHLELGAAGEMLSKNSQIRVELGCTCTEGPMEEMLCFLHHPEEELRENQAPSLLRTLCTGSYLDAQKTAHWFHQLVITSWVLLPWSSQYNLKMLPCGRSCKFHMTKGNQKVLSVEIIFGVQLGDSDIYLSSQTAEPGLIPSTMWPQSCVVAEAKFFREMAREVPYNSFHLKCLQVCARIVVGTAFSTYTFKMVVMHLLTTIPPSDWCREHFLLRLLDIMRYLRCCLQEKRLDHIFFGNEHVPEEIDLPPAFRTAEPPNLFQHLAQDPAAHAEAMREFHYLRERLTSLLFYGH